MEGSRCEVRLSGINFVTDFMKIGEMIHNLKCGRGIQRGNLVRILFFLFKEET